MTLTIHKSPPRRKRIHHVAPALLADIPSLFDRVADDEALAREFDVPRMDLLAYMVRDTRKLLGKGPQRAGSLTGAAPARLEIVARARRAG